MKRIHTAVAAVVVAAAVIAPGASAATIHEHINDGAPLWVTTRSAAGTPADHDGEGAATFGRPLAMSISRATIVHQGSLSPKTRFTAAAFASMGSLLLSACGDGSVTPDPDATARLDRDSGQVILPLDVYAITRADEDVMTRARLAILRSCLQPKGHNGVAPPASAGSPEERPYGLWLPEFAASNGFALQPLGDAPDLTPPPGG